MFITECSHNTKHLKHALYHALKVFITHYARFQRSLCPHGISYSNCAHIHYEKMQKVKARSRAPYTLYSYKWIFRVTLGRL